MGRLHKASEVFNDLPAGIKEKVFQLGAGKLVYFPSTDPRKPVDKVAVCIRYGEGLSFTKVGEEFGVSRERAYRIVAEERGVYSKGRAKLWRERGMSLRAIGRLFKKSHEAMR